MPLTNEKKEVFFVSEEKKTGESLFEPSPGIQPYARVFDVSPIAVMIIRLLKEKCEFSLGRLEYVNTALKRDFMTPSGKFFGNSADIHAQRDKNAFMERVIQKNGESASFTYYDELIKKYVQATGYLDGEYVICQLTDVTNTVMESKKNTSLRLSEQKREQEWIYTLLNQVNVGIVVCEYSHNKENILLENHRMRQILGTDIGDRGRIKKNLAKSVLSEKDNRIFYDALENLLTGIDRKTWETQITNQETGKKLWVLVSANVMSRNNGNVQIIMCCTDISKRKNAEQSLIESQQNLNVAIAHAGIHYWNYDMKSDTIYMNEQTSQDFEMDGVLTDYPNCWVKIGMVHPDDTALFLDMLMRVKQGELYVTFQARIRNVRTKTYEWKNIKFTTFTDKDGTPTYAVATAEDAVAYKKLEESMAQMMIQNGIWSWEFDVRNRCLYKINDFGGISPFGLFGDDIKDVPESLFSGNAIFSEDIDRCRQAFDKIFSGQDRVKIQCRTWSAKAKDYVWYEYNASVIEKEGKTPIRAILTCRDISDEKRIEQVYFEEQQVLIESDEALISSSRVNLSKNRVESFVVKEDNISMEKAVCLLDYRERMSYCFDHMEIAESDNQALFVNNLYRTYKSGISELQVRYIAQRKNRKETICVRVDCRMLKRPESGDVIAFFYERDDTDSYINDLAVNAIVENDYDFMAVIFVNSMQFLVVKAEEDLDAIPAYQLNYEEQIRHYYDTMEKEQADHLVSLISFDRVRQQLDKEETYSVEFDVKEKGKNRRKQFRFSYMDQEKNIIFVTRIDISEIIQKEKEAQIQLEDALNAAELANNAKSEFLSTVSHEIRTPMNVIMGMTELAMDESDNHEAIMGYIEQINISSHHLLNLVNNVLDMSKIESGEFSLYPLPYTVEELKKNVGAVIAPMCEQKNITYTVKDLTGGKQIIADKMRLNQVFINLLSNAVKYTNEGGKVSLICRAKEKEDGMLATEFLVQDNGIGMSREFQEKMFRPFTQESNEVVASTQGTGLGLSIAKGIVEKMNGTLSVESEVGKGTTFIVRIDFLQPKTDLRERVSKEEKQEFDFTGKQILVAEDHEMNRMILTKLLEKKKAKVTTAENGKEALDYFAAQKEGSIDAILMDVRMPVMDGLEATRAIRALSRSDAKEVPIIAMTANAYDEDKEKSSSAGMNGHLAKPIDTKLLYRTLQEFFFEK